MRVEWDFKNQCLRASACRKNMISKREPYWTAVLLDKSLLKQTRAAPAPSATHQQQRLHQTPPIATNPESPKNRTSIICNGCPRRPRSCRLYLAVQHDRSQKQQEQRIFQSRCVHHNPLTDVTLTTRTPSPYLRRLKFRGLVLRHGPR